MKSCDRDRCTNCHDSDTTLPLTEADLASLSADTKHLAAKSGMVVLEQWQVPAPRTKHQGWTQHPCLWMLQIVAGHLKHVGVRHQCMAHHVCTFRAAHCWRAGRSSWRSHSCCCAACDGHNAIKSRLSAWAVPVWRG